jgi:hypothetical protein
MKYRIVIASVAVLALAGCGGATAAASGQGHPAAPASVAATLSAEQIAARMGLYKTGKVFAYNAQTDPNSLLGRQGEYTSKVNWGGDTSYASDNSIEVFTNPADAAARLSYLSAFKPPFGDGYDYQSGSALLRLSANLTPSQAQALKAQFDAIVGA